MKNDLNQQKLREQMLIAGIQEIDAKGITNFSLRRVAASCNISCATPYSYFKNKEEFILEIIRYINGHWALIQSEVQKTYAKNIQKQILELCIAYIRFLNANPNFRSIIMLSSAHMDAEQLKEKALIMENMEQMVISYCKNKQYSEEECKKRAFLIRSVVFGAAFMLDSGTLNNDESTFFMIKNCILEQL